MSESPIFAHFLFFGERFAHNRSFPLGDVSELLRSLTKPEASLIDPDLKKTLCIACSSCSFSALFSFIWILFLFSGNNKKEKYAME